MAALNPDTGLLPEGEHPLDWKSIVSLFGTSPRRQGLLQKLHELCLILKRAGVETVWLDGSFVTSKPTPNDFDMSFDLSDAAFARLPDYPFKVKNAATRLRSHFCGDIKVEPMADGYRYHKDLWPYVKDHEHNGKAIFGLKKGIVVIALGDLPERSGLEAAI